jgi:hypothetical protein
MMLHGTSSKFISIAAVVAALGTYAVAKWRAQYYVAEGAFWFEDVTYELPHLRAAGLGGPITADEKAIIESVAWSELRGAFAGLRVTFSDNRNARCKVQVVQQYPEARGGPGAAGATRAVRPFGGYGSVNFLMLASQAVSHAPPGADRATVIQGIGRGIGRAAVHEFLHQLVPDVPIHETTDESSYEYAYSARPAQYYGPMRWGVAWPALQEKFGKQSTE